MNQSEFQKMLESHPYLKEDLFIRGFLITDQKPEDLTAFPFYGNWRIEEHGGFYFLAHKLTGMHVFSDEIGNHFFIMGHAYNPFTMKYQEIEILEDIAKAYYDDRYLDKVNDLTGVYVTGVLSKGTLSYLVDTAGMQSVCNGVIDNHFYLTSHAQLIGDLLGLEMDPFVKELTEYKWYGRIVGPYLPGDMMPFKELIRVVPSQLYKYDGKISHTRFWPLIDQKIAVDEKDYEEVIQKASAILKNNMELVSHKWEHPWISLTGGIDSNTTFASANGIYDRFETFSYISAEKEIRDAKAAHTIAEHFHIPHHVYRVPENSDQLEDFEQKRELLRHNNGYIAELYDNEARKRVYLRQNAKCDVEVKSWVSESIRAYWYKYYNRKSMPALSPKLYRNLYKIFILNRPLAHKIDRIFDAYIKEYEHDKIPACYPPADVHYNEVTYGSYGGLNISEMKYCFDITFIYNNRRFFDLMFQIPLEKRISDQHHMDMKKVLNPELYDMGIRVVNMKETKFRANALNALFTINSILPF